MRCLLLFAPLLLLLTCGPGQPPAGEPALIALPEVRYLADARELRGQLTLLQGDSLPAATPFSPAGGVTFMGNTTREIPLGNDLVRYETTLRMPYPADSVAFRFTGPGGQPRELKLHLAPPVVTGLPDTIYRSRGLSFSAGSGPLGADESLLLFFSDDQGNARQVLIAGPSRDSLLRAPAPSLSSVGPGKHQLYLVKKRDYRGRIGGLNVTGYVEYYTEEVPVHVAD